MANNNDELNNSSEATKQVDDKNPMNLNPEGKGGFGDHPENRNKGGRPENKNSFTYWMNFFKEMSSSEFLAWEKNTPTDQRTVAQDISFVRVFNARKDLQEFKEVADRTEGKIPQGIKHSGEIDTGSREIASTLQGIYNSQNQINKELSEGDEDDKPGNEPSD